jgi:transcriptional regulator with XRE-family HTH domain
MASDIYIFVGERIQEFRMSKNWRQIDLAEHAGINEKG